MGWSGSRRQKESRPGTASWEPSRLGLGGEADTHTNDGMAKTEQALIHTRDRWSTARYEVCNDEENAALRCSLLSPDGDGVFRRESSDAVPDCSRSRAGAGQTVTVSEADATFRFDGVSGDSRCPIDAICIQGGDALVQIAVLRARSGAQAYTLHTGNLRPVVHDDLTIALVDLSPYPLLCPAHPAQRLSPDPANQPLVSAFSYQLSAFSFQQNPSELNRTAYHRSS